jgi:hypothetical protein
VQAVTRTSDWDVDGFAITVVIVGGRVACSAFKHKILYSASWDQATMMHCALASGSEAIEKPLPSGLMVAFAKARILAIDKK